MEELSDLITTRDCLGIRLGPDLVKKIYNIKNKYGGIGFGLGITLGPLAGVLLTNYFNLGMHPGWDGRMPSDAQRMFFGGFIGFTLGMNAGYALGLLYAGKRGIKKLLKRFPEKANYIKEYADVTTALTAISVRLPIS